MINFKDFFNNLIFEGKVKKYQNFIHMFDIPMFSVFFDKNIFKNEELMNIMSIKYMKSDNEDERNFAFDLTHRYRIEQICAEARNAITKLGFPSMHVNLVFTDNSKLVNINTGKTGDVSGYARQDRHYMSIDINTYLKYRVKYANYLAKILIHEWAHMWMFNNSSAFKQAVKELYDKLVLNKETLNKNPESEKQYNNFTVVEILKSWESSLNRIREYISNYLVKKLDVNQNTVQYLPHLLSVTGYLKKDLSHDLKKGQRVYCLKANGIWIIGYRDHNHTRHEHILPTLDLKQLNSLIRFVEFKNVEQAIKDSLNRMEHITEKHIDDVINDYVLSFFEDYLRIYQYINVPDEEVQKVLPDYSKYIKDAVLDLFNNATSEDIIKFLSNKEEGYKFLWLNNKFKPKQVSISELVKPYAIEKMMKSFTSSIKDLAGSQHDNLRQFVNKEIKWVSAYGMSDNYELWATAIEHFFQLTDEHKKIFINLISNKISANPTKQKEYKQKAKPIKPSERRKAFKQKVFDKLKSLIEPDVRYLIDKDGRFDEFQILQLTDRTIRDLKIRTKSNLLSKIIYNATVEILTNNKAVLSVLDKKRLKKFIDEKVERIKRI
jgi:hypothetical protein